MVWMDDVDALPESELLAAARRGDPAAFERLVSSHRRELYAHCYRMLGSVQDGEDALQASHQHRVTGRLLRETGPQRHGPADGPQLRRLQRRTAPRGGHPAARAEHLPVVQGLLAPDGRPSRRHAHPPGDLASRGRHRQVVVSNSITAEQTEPWRDTTRIVPRADAHERIAELKGLSGREVLVFGSRTLWNDLLTAGLVDELHLIVGPGVLGGGAPAFGNAPAAPFRLLDTRMWEGSNNALFQYVAAGQAA
jgi:hypothetical protein